MDSTILGMSDEDFLNGGSNLDVEPEVSPQEEMGDEPEEVSVEEVDEIDSGSGLEEEEYAASSEVEEEPAEDLPPEDEEEDEELEEVPEDVPTELTGVEDLQKVLQPFRANGKDVQVKNAAEAITLMQLGANYTKKMQELSPNLKALKTLEKHELLDEGKLNYLIDLSKNDPKAIAKLIKDAEYEPESYVNDDEDVEYTPTNHQVSDKAMELEQVLESLESTPTYDKCIDLVGNQWDEKSKQLLTQDPQLIRSLNEQMQAGVFEKVNSEVERAKMFGGLSGLSDFEAYRTVGAQLMQQGQLSPPQAPQPVAKTQVKPLDKAISKQRKAATTSKSTHKTTAKKKESLLAMSDADFLKINNIQL